MKLCDLTNEFEHGLPEDIQEDEVCSLLNCSPYESNYALWHRLRTKEKKEEDEKLSEKSKIREGIKGVIENLFTQDREMIKKRLHLHSNLSYRSLYSGEQRLNIGATVKTASAVTRVGVETSLLRSAVVYPKYVNAFDFADNWVKDSKGDLIAPQHIEVRLQHKMLVSGFKKAYLAILVDGSDFMILEREANEKFQQFILDSCLKFQKSLISGDGPEREDTDCHSIIKRYKNVDVGTVDPDPGKYLDLVRQYNEYSKAEKEIKLKKDNVKADILVEMDRFEKVKHPDFSITAGVIHAGEVKYKRKEGRGFRITTKKSFMT